MVLLFTPIRMANTENNRDTDDTKCWEGMQGFRRSQALLMGMQTGSGSLKKERGSFL